MTLRERRRARAHLTADVRAHTRTAVADPLSFLWSKEFLTGLLTAGGLVTLWKWIAGWNRINLSLVIENRRTPAVPSGTDHLVSLLKLKKGDRATLAMESIRFVVTVDHNEVASGGVEEIKLSEVTRTLNITPGEETHFAFHCAVPTDAVCKITATVTGRSLRKWAPLAVWKATDFSVPVAPQRGASAEP